MGTSFVELSYPLWTVEKSKKIDARDTNPTYFVYFLMTSCRYICKYCLHILSCYVTHIHHKGTKQYGSAWGTESFCAQSSYILLVCQEHVLQHPIHRVCGSRTALGRKLVNRRGGGRRELYFKFWQKIFCPCPLITRGSVHLLIAKCLF